MYVNCAHGKGIKFIREELKFFAKTHINSNGGNYSGKMAQRKINFQIPGIEQMPKKITINKQSLSILDASETRGISAGEQAIWNLGKQHQLLLPVGFSSKPIQILINW